MSRFPFRLQTRTGWLLPGVFWALVALSTGYAVISACVTPNERVIKLTVRRFEYSKNVIVLKKGQPVVIEITSLDVPHGFSVPEFNVRVDMVLPGKVSRVRFTPDKEGAFAYLCDILCGAGQEQLEGRLFVRN